MTDREYARACTEVNTGAPPETEFNVPRDESEVLQWTTAASVPRVDRAAAANQALAMLQKCAGTAGTYSSL